MIVLDASALVEVVADRPLKNAVLDQLADPKAASIAAPAHQLAEVASALSRLERASELSAADTKRGLSDAAMLVQDLVPLDERLLLRAFALRGSIRVLDGLYVALAERLDCPLVTTDGRLARADPPCEVIVAGR